MHFSQSLQSLLGFLAYTWRGQGKHAGNLQVLNPIENSRKAKAALWVTEYQNNPPWVLWKSRYQGSCNSWQGTA